MYTSIVKPVPHKIETAMLKEMNNYIKSQIDLKVQGGILAGTAMSLQKTIINDLVMEERDALLPFFENLKQNYANKTDYKNIAAQLVTADGRTLIRSWDLESHGQNVANNPLIQQVMKDKKAVGSLGIGALGVGVVGISPIFEDTTYIGMISIIQGLASVAKSFKADKNGDWVLLVDKRYIAEKYGSMPIVESNEPVGQNYLVANNRWFDANSVKMVKQFYQPVQGDVQKTYVAGGKVFIDIPAYDEENQMFGRHLFLIEEQLYQAPIDQAIHEAWISLAGVILSIFALVFVLVIAIIKMVVNPLIRVQQYTAKILETGDFSIRAPVHSQDEVGQTAQALNSVLEQVGNGLKEANQTVGAIAQGDLSQRITGQYLGDLAQLQKGVNHSADNIALVMAQLSKVMQAMSDGQFDIQISTDAKGDYQKMMLNAQNSMKQTNVIIKEINDVMGSMTNGEFKHRVKVNAKGELEQLKQRINESMNAIDEAISDITRVVVAQSEGDLTQTIDRQYEGDLMLLKNAVNQSVSKLAVIVSQAVAAADIVNNAAEEVSNGSHDLSTRVQRQAAALEQTSASMDQMNSAVQNNTENAQHASKVVLKVQKESVQATEVMQQTITAMNAIQQSSHKISDIVTLIDSIAFQTNLLALNAAVEAARAGDHGRGFAVVAGEVRNLAQKSADAAKDIKTLINESVQRIDEGTRLATDSGKVINGITQLIEEVTDMITQIAKASSEQAEGVHQVHIAITEIDSTTQQNAALVEETSATAETMSEQATELSHSMAYFKTNHAKQSPKRNHAESSTQPNKALAVPKKDSATSALKPLPAPKTSATTQPKALGNAVQKPAAKPSTDPDTWEDF